MCLYAPLLWTALEVRVEDDLILLQFVGTNVGRATRNPRVVVRGGSHKRAALILLQIENVVALINPWAVAKQRMRLG